jgi:hypothetical protein
MDGDPATTWSTPAFASDQAVPAMGLVVDAGRALPIQFVELRTPTPGWTVELYAATGDQPPATLPDPGWVHLSTLRETTPVAQLPAGAGKRKFRHFLVWITRLPPQGTKVEISELALLR